MKLSIVVPVYKEEGNVPEFLKRIIPILESLTPEFEIIFAMDPSPDRTEQVIQEWHERDRRVKLIKFSRRFGQPQATIGGLAHSKGDAVVVMDVDLQDPPDLLPRMVARWRDDGFDVVVAQRAGREGETLVKRIVSSIGYKLIHKIADVSIPPDAGDFRLLSRRVVDQVLQLKESHGFLRGMVALVGFKQTTVLFERPPRFSGKGNYNRFLGSLRIGMNGIIAFSSKPLTLASVLGFAASGFSFLVTVYYFILKVLFHVDFTPGLPTTVITITFFGGVQLICLGIVGEYIGRIYDEVRERPKFIVEKRVGFDGD